MYAAVCGGASIASQFVRPTRVSVSIHTGPRTIGTAHSLHFVSPVAGPKPGESPQAGATCRVQ